MNSSHAKNTAEKSFGVPQKLDLFTLLNMLCSYCDVQEKLRLLAGPLPLPARPDLLVPGQQLLLASRSGAGSLSKHASLWGGWGDWG